MAFVCVRGPKSMCAKQHFGLDFNLSDKNLIQLCSFQRELKQIDFSVLRSTAGSISPSLTLVQTMGAVCSFDQGHVYVDDNEESAGCPKSVVTLPSKYTCFPSQHPLFFCSCLYSVDWVFYLWRSVGNTNKASQNQNGWLQMLTALLSGMQCK